jgi:hypothetical protein
MVRSLGCLMSQHVILRWGRKMDQFKINYVPTLMGVYPNEIRWSCRIGDESFEYKTGLGYLKTLKDLKDVPKDKRNILQLTRDQVINSGIHKNIKPTSRSIGVSYYDVDEFLRRGVGVEHPKLEQLLYCLFLDSSAHEVSFRDWCFEFGYDEDSIKAESIYDACIENYFKLRKALGSQYETVKEYIEKLEL